MKKALDIAQNELIEKLPKYRKVLPDLLEAICSIKSKKRTSCIVLFSYVDNKLIIFS